MCENTVMGKILGIDFGTKYIGLAISDDTHSFSTPLTSLTKRKGLSEAGTVAKHIEKEGLKIDRLVVGNPLGLAGKPTRVAKLVTEFANELSSLTCIPYTLWEETGTSQLAGKLNPKQDNHAKAAQLILQEYLDFLHTGI